jgi:uncharacterized membrane protein required for colicin V production
MFANILFDLILAGILAAGVILGIKNGFISTVAKPVKFIAAIAIALSLAAGFGSVFIEPIVGPAISNKVSGILVEKYADITAETASAELPTLIKFAASMCGVDISTVASAAEGNNIIVSIVDTVTHPVVEIVSTIAGFIIVYFVAKILLGILLHLINELFDSGIAGTANKILGAVFTFLLAFCVAWAFTAFSEFFLNIPLIAKANWVSNFEGGILYKFFRLFTPLDLLLSF